MDEIQQQAVVATSAINKLQDLHKVFVSDLEVAAKRSSEIGTLSVSSSSISCSCFGHSVSATHRPIALDGQICALEYDFVTQWKKEEISILRLYLQPGGVLTRDAKGTAKLCDFNNTYIKNHILAAVSESLLKSPVYAPAEG